jgi:hypothetical protein
MQQGLGIHYAAKLVKIRASDLTIPMGHLLSEKKDKFFCGFYAFLRIDCLIEQLSCSA